MMTLDDLDIFMERINWLPGWPAGQPGFHMGRVVELVEDSGAKVKKCS